MVETDLKPDEGTIEAIALQADGKVIAAGRRIDGHSRFALARYNRDGSLDPGFGAGGLVETDFEGDIARAESVVVQADGKVVAAGGVCRPQEQPPRLCEYSFALARYNPDGSLDPGFGAGGKVRTPIAADSTGARAVALQRDGKLLAAGPSWSGGEQVFAVARYELDGRLDAGFGESGIARVAFEHNARPDGLVVQPDGRIVVAGRDIQFDPPIYALALARLNPNGSPDGGFGAGGKVRTPLPTPGRSGSGSDSEDVVLLPNGKLVAGAWRQPLRGPSFLARYNADGSLDRTFGSEGLVAASGGVAAPLAVQPDSKLLAGGSASDPAHDPPGGFRIARYRRDGSLDSTFGDGGIVTTYFGPPRGRINYDSAHVNDLALAPSGRLVAGGYTEYDSGAPRTQRSNFALAAYTTLPYDHDGDGLPDEIERRLGTSNVDLDTDDDGLSDGREDRNRNARVDRGETHPRRADTDRDGLPDGLELGVAKPITAPDAPLRGTAPRRFEPDRDPRSRTSPVRGDTDRDGLPDGREDRNRNGRRELAETDPLRSDTDRDGRLDGADRNPLRR